MSKQQTTIVLELTRDEALGILALAGDTTGRIGYELFNVLDNVLYVPGGNGTYDEAQARFPTLKGTGSF